MAGLAGLAELAGTVGEVIVSGEYAAKTGFKATTHQRLVVSSAK
jgi:hypothetical protein